MKPGRELDALVAEKVMGWPTVQDETNLDRLGSVGCVWNGTPYTVRGWHRRPFSTDIASAWEVVEKLQELGIEPMVEWDAEDQAWYCSLSKYDPVTTFSAQLTQAGAPTAPHAICLAALKAVGVEI